MCVVSAVMDYGQQLWPQPQKPWMTPLVPDIPIDIAPDKPLTLKDFAKKEEGRLPTAAEIKAFKKLVDAAERFDAIANQPHCEDPEKIKLLQRLEERLARIEAAVGAPGPDDLIQVHAHTLEAARVFYSYLTSSISAHVDFSVVSAGVLQSHPEADVVEAERRARAAYDLLHEV
ncbi:hypothetical protein CcrColossus_gp051 [Caulobacter phage CcrColossus]|uniref:Uncharacterized protein n=1 Tax=Caulobacter phage CcrColossus TaxID=1211640 RepID=K4JS53_9CAUD|nr:hypothetical protein CcrColossus_gp051 [Caulobacter phage CcrColossus]AFU87921.1 hypothetical protein CcrColossus_gp051 [Caulobacter phage CcrColossus]